MMSNNPIALSNIVMELPNEADDNPAELIEIATAIDRITAEIAISEKSATGALDAIERIQDIAFVLHERSVEHTLCDTLDAAVREISDASVRSHAIAERVRNANELLDALAVRVRELIARARMRPHSDDPVAATAAVRSIDERLASASMDVASLEVDAGNAAPSRASFPGLAAEQGDAEEADNVIPPRSDAVPSGQRSNDDLLPPLDLDMGAPMERAAEQSSPAHSDESSEHMPAHGQSNGSQAFSGPEEDPANSFERDLGAGADTSADQQANPVGLVEDAPSPHDANAASASASATPLSTDALAAVRALSEEELIALFS